jgi:hypothetical protein
MFFAKRVKTRFRKSKTKGSLSAASSQSVVRLLPCAAFLNKAIAGFDPKKANRNRQEISGYFRKRFGLKSRTIIKK